MMEKSQIVKNTFMEFYRATMAQNITGWKSKKFKLSKLSLRIINQHNFMIELK